MSDRFLSFVDGCLPTWHVLRESKVSSCTKTGTEPCFGFHVTPGCRSKPLADVVGVTYNSALQG